MCKQKSGFLFPIVVLIGYLVTCKESINFEIKECNSNLLYEIMMLITHINVLIILIYRGAS